MVNSKLTQDESGSFTTTNDFRKIGLLTDPNQDGSFTKYTSTTATQAKTFTYTSNTAALSGDITITQGNVGANGATAYIVDVNASASTIRVIDVTNGATLTVTASGTSNPTATAAAQTGTNRVEFTFTVPNAATTLSIGAQTISGTIKDAGTNTASDKAFVAGDVIGAGGSGSTKTVAVA